MSPFGDDFFDEIEKAFFGSTGGIPGRARTSSYGDVVRGEKEERVIDYIEDKDEVFFIFELPGFNEEDVGVSVKGDSLKIDVLKKNFSEVKPYLKSKLSEDVSYTKKIPVKVKKDFEKSFNNGILEVRFKRK
jgi:HSP20 family molecular chaperone IbpA